MQNDYPELKPGYRPAFKSIASYKTDKVNVSGANSDVSFRTEWGVPAIGMGNELTIRGGGNGDETILYAYSKQDSTETVVGKLNVLSFDEQTKKVYLVSVNGAEIRDIDKIEEELNKIYAPAVTKWQVTKADNIQVTFPNGRFTHGGSSAISVYNADQKTVIKAFGKQENDALYLFFVDDVKGKDASGDFAGYMPLAYQSGFIYDNPNAATVAHELAHGAFNLHHTFGTDNFIAAQSTTDNLMDYKGGTELWAHQWKLIHDPKNVWLKFLQDEEEGEAKGVPTGDLAYRIQQLASELGLKLGEDAFAAVHSFKCDNIGEITRDIFEVEEPIDEYRPEGYPKYIKLFNRQESDTVNVVLIFRNENSFVPESNSSIGSAGDFPVPYLGIFGQSGNNFICGTQIESLAEYTCIGEESLAQKILREDYRGLYISKILKVLHDCLDEMDHDEAGSKAGDRFYVEFLPTLTTETEIKQLRAIADEYNNIGDLLLKNNDKNAWNDYGDFFRAAYTAYLENSAYDEYLERLQNTIKHFENKKEFLQKLNDKQSIGLVVCSFSDVELTYLPFSLRKHALQYLVSSELKGLLISPIVNEESIALRLLRYIKQEEISTLLETVGEGNFLAKLDKGFNDLFTLIDDNYAKYIDILDGYICKSKGINENNWNDILVNLYEQDKCYDLTRGNTTTKYLSDADILFGGVVRLETSRFTGETKSVYVGGGNYGGATSVQMPVIEKNNMTLAFDEPIALYHNAYLRGVSTEKRGEIEIASALKMHYYLACNQNENIKTTASIIIDIASIPIGGAGIAKGGVRLIFGIADIASSVISLTATIGEKYIIDNYENGEAYIRSMHIVSAAIGFSELGASQVMKLNNLLSNDIVTIGRFHNNPKNAEKILTEANVQNKELFTRSQQLVDRFSEYDVSIKRLIEAAQDGKYTRNLINRESGFIDLLDDLLKNEGLTLDDFHYMIQKNVNALTSLEKVQLAYIRSALPMPDANTLMQKAIPQRDIMKYISGDYGQVGGFVSRASDTKHLKSFEDLYYGLRLDYAETTFFIEEGSCGIIRFKSLEVPQKAVVPMGGTFDDISYPFTSTGITSGRNGRLGAPELNLPQKIRFNDGDEIWEIFNDGTEILRAVYEDNKFIVIK